jgi:hypothetical protein
MKKLIAGLALTLTLALGAFAADDIDGAYTELKAAQDAKKPAAEIKTAALAVLQFAAKNPDDAHNKEVATQAEYALLTAGLAGSTAEQIDLFGALETANPKSEYLPSAYPYYLAALGKSAPAKVGPTIDKALTNFPDDADLLAAGATNAMARQQADKALSLAQKALAAKGKKPEGVDQATWDKQQAQLSASMRFVSGVVEGSKNKFFECNRDLRAALPGLQAGQTQTANYYIGLCTYQLGRQIVNKAQVLEGAKFMDAAAATPGPMQSQAFSAAQAIKAEAARMR